MAEKYGAELKKTWSEVVPKRPYKRDIGEIWPLKTKLAPLVILE